jgi:dissimilatory sulfite reductase (desulfoviridin) alpha/beta subunit
MVQRKSPKHTFSVRLSKNDLAKLCKIMDRYGLTKANDAIVYLIRSKRLPKAIEELGEDSAEGELSL